MDIRHFLRRKLWWILLLAPSLDLTERPLEPASSTTNPSRPSASCHPSTSSDNEEPATKRIMLEQGKELKGSVMASKMRLLARSVSFIQQSLRQPSSSQCLRRAPQMARFCSAQAGQIVTNAPAAAAPPPAEVDRPALLRPLAATVPASAADVRQVWVENMDATEERKLGLLELHPEVFAAFPKLHLIHDNVRWQRMYRHVDYATTKTRAEVRGGGRKPHAQKGGGRARAGSIRSPLWKGGGVSHGPRGPKTHFYMLPHSARVGGLCATLSVKLAQNDLHVVQDLELPSGEAGFLQQLAERRLWGTSVLFVDDTDEMPENLVCAAAEVPHYNLLPVYGLNVFTMLKHDTLVLTVAAVERIQERLLHALSLHDSMSLKHTDAALLR